MDNTGAASPTAREVPLGGEEDSGATSLQNDMRAKDVLTAGVTPYGRRWLSPCVLVVAGWHRFRLCQLRRMVGVTALLDYVGP
jgi:hypothetical protein